MKLLLVILAVSSWGSLLSGMAFAQVSEEGPARIGYVYEQDDLVEEGNCTLCGPSFLKDSQSVLLTSVELDEGFAYEIRFYSDESLIEDQTLICRFGLGVAGCVFLFEPPSLDERVEINLDESREFATALTITYLKKVSVFGTDFRRRFARSFRLNEGQEPGE